MLEFGTQTIVCVPHVGSNIISHFVVSRSGLLVSEKNQAKQGL